MKSLYARGVVVALGLVCLARGTQAEESFGSPSLLPLPAISQSFPARQVAHENLWNEPPVAPQPTPDHLPSPSDQVIQSPKSVISGDYQSAMANEWAPASCTSGVCGQGGCQNNWFVSSSALLMTRVCNDDVNMSFDTGGPNTVLCTCDTDMDLTGGFEITAGRAFNNGCNALAVTYWGLYPSDRSATAYGSNMVGNLNANMDFSGLSYDDGTGVQTMDNYFDNAAVHNICSSTTIQNVEINLLGGCCGVTPWSCGYRGTCPRLSCNWLAGIRIFEFNEGFCLSSDNTDTVFNGGLNEVYYEVQTQNSLVGFQVGGGYNYAVNNSWSLYGTGKAGVYGAKRSAFQRVYGANGNAIINSGAYAGDDCGVYAEDTGLAVIGQLGMGANWQINSRWSATLGYRVFGAAGVATLNDQISNDLTNVGAMHELNGNGSLLLHGGYAGLQFCF